MRGTVYFKEEKTGLRFPILNRRGINFNTPRGLKRQFRRVVEAKYDELVRFFGNGHTIIATVEEDNGTVHATTKIKLGI